MGNDEFLITSYFLGGTICLCLALAAYAWLRRPAERIFGALHRPQWERILKRSFPTSTVLLALSAFMAVSYYGYGCASRKYKDIVSDRTYIISVNQKQISETSMSIVIAVLVWALIILLNLIIIRRALAKESSDQNSSRGTSAGADGQLT